MSAEIVGDKLWDVKLYFTCTKLIMEVQHAVKIGNL